MLLNIPELMFINKQLKSTAEAALHNSPKALGQDVLKTNYLQKLLPHFEHQLCFSTQFRFGHSTASHCFEKKNYHFHKE